MKHVKSSISRTVLSAILTFSIAILFLDKFTVDSSAASTIHIEYYYKIDIEHGDKEKPLMVNNQGCSFGQCPHGKQRCCQMARQQMQECRAADQANAGNYRSHGAAGQQASQAIKECVRCSQVWLRNNRC
jgi:hypothetical protein